MTQKKDERSKNWVAIFYPESLPSDWLIRCRELRTDVIISPLHDKDLLEDGTLKKAHYHVIFKFSSNKSFEQVKTMLEPFNCPQPQKVANMKGQVRYLVHIDDPQKHRYNVEDIQIIGNVDITPYFQISQTDRYSLIAEMMDFVSDNFLTEFYQLMNYARKHRSNDWFPLLCDNSAFVMDKFINSFRNKHREDDILSYQRKRNSQEDDEG